ncbi:pilus assembly PilX family protein [Cerasicoccus arenae]|uniref:Uncharacterized protein n=1 Tax=Cerasicoccus arenae TaxID=424488 RepID=A0A8J3GF11_9BACT|nr:hypothetical protein [Cerasicoccus arenae]MBK1857397.1 hypothetical protein [Cerasicoccus arenae]GHC07961.1 hypothetical protein GCM10007047_26520 [Cerasicoccus arenae]
MNISTQASHHQRGSAIMVVLLLTTAIGIIAGSVLRSSLTEKKVNVRNSLRSEALRAAEIGIELAFAEYVNDVETNSGLYAAAVASPIQKIDLSSRGKSLVVRNNITSIDVRSEFVPLPVRRFIDGEDPANDDDPLKNKFVIETNINLYAKVEAKRGGETVEVYLAKTMAIRDAPLFSHAIFFNDDLLFHRNFDIAGDVHSNGHLQLNTHNGDDPLRLGELTTAVGNVYRLTTVDSSNMGNRLSTGDNLITVNGDLDLDHMNYSTSGTVYSNNILVKSGVDSRMSDWLEHSQSTFHGSLMDKAYGVPVFKPVGAEDAQKDNVYTKNVNELNNSGYALIEPLLPSGHSAVKNNAAREGKMAAKAGLLLRVEQNQEWVPRDYRGRYTTNPSKIVNDNEYYVVKGYKYTTRVEDGTPVLKSVSLPDRLIGTANSSISSVNSGQPYPEKYSESSSAVTGGLQDTRTGRSMDLITMDVSRLKEVIESDPSKLDTSGKNFRNEFSNTSDWNGVVYVEFPTSTNVDNSASTNSTDINSKPFQYGSAETNIPELASQYGTASWKHTPKSRTDEIVPIAAEFRTLDPADTGMGLQLIKGSNLPSVGGNEGLTVATNTSMYVVDHYNADGNFRTGTGLQYNDGRYADEDSGHGEVPAALMADSVTLLSGAWPSNRANSHKGYSGQSSTRKANEPLEVSACIASADYSVYEFFVRSLENWQHLLNDSDVGGLGHKNPIVVKGSLVSFWDSEIPLMKDAYGRDKSKPVDKYWNEFASHAFTTPRFHQFLVDGRFPPGTPTARFYDLREYIVLHRGEVADKTELTKVGFTL